MTGELFKIGQTVTSETSHQLCRVESVLGGGGQGEVYGVSLGGRELALKWYFPHTATDRQRRLLETLIRKGPPAKEFLWPMELVSGTGRPGFGYLMPRREARYRGMAGLMKRQFDPSFFALATAGFSLAHSFLQLHSKGFCYRDISFGNVFFDPHSGEVLVCDNDNVAIDGELSSGILGTPRFMAPEVVRGEALPSIQTDLYSLAVLLFYMFLVHHPLEGKREAGIHSFDLPAMRLLYGSEPLFIFDPDDRANEPLPGNHDNALAFWPIYPEFLRQIFTKAFTEGLRDPSHGRVREGEWRAVMLQVRNSIFYCGDCATENFYDPDRLKRAGGDPGSCWSCGHPLTLPFRMRVARQVVMLNHDTVLFPHHLDENRPYDFSAPAAAVTRHPEREDLWGLKNLSEESWSFLAPSATSPREVAPGASVSLVPSTRINFGRTEGEIHY